MNGGLYGRGKAPERACMPLCGWPDEDRWRWAAACAPSDLLCEDIGARSNRARITNRKAEKGYGRWLTFLGLHESACLMEAPECRITPARVSAYVETLVMIGNSTATILARLQELGEVAKVMGPIRRWDFINTLSSKIRARHRPARSKNHLKLSDELLDLGFALMARASEAEELDRAILHRDGLMIALLALVPLRRRNIAGLRLDRNLKELNGSWLIVFDGSETKTHCAIEIDWPSELNGPLSLYLQTHRPILSARSGRWSKPIDNALWVSSHGSPMTEMAIYDRICLHTADAFGLGINPHLFRDAAATTLAILDPEHVRVSAPLLGHRTFSTTERYYQQAKSFEAHAAYIDAVFVKEKVDGKK